MQYVFLGAAGILVVAFGSAYGLARLGFARRAQNDPEAFLAKMRGDGERVVVCAGDSLTHATLSADYVALLRARFGSRGYVFVNAGLNGHTAGDLLQRLDPIVACRPDAISILIGTNDVRLGFDDEAASAFRTNLDRILTRLSRDTDAKLAIASIPPLGEELASLDNRAADRCNAIIREIARERRVEYIAVNERLRELLERAGRPVQPGSGTFGTSLGLGIAFRRYVGRQSWDRIATAHGAVLLTDQVHLSDKAASEIADHLARWLDRL